MDGPLEDYMKPFVVIKPDSETLILKILALTYGLACVIFTFLVEFLGPGILQASLTIFGVVGGPLLGLFSLGMMTTRANQRGALLGRVCNMVTGNPRIREKNPRKQAQGGTGLRF